MTPVDALIYFLLGFWRGISDIFPIDGNAHILFIADTLQRSGQEVIHLKTAVDAFQLGSALAVVLHFRKDLIWRIHIWWSIKKTPLLQNRMRNLFSCLSVAFAIAALIRFGFVPELKKNLNIDWLYSPFWGAIFLLFNGIFIISCSLYRVKNQQNQLEDLSLKQFLLFAFLQGIAVLPGISRLAMIMGAAIIVNLIWFDGIKLAFFMLVISAIATFLFNILNCAVWTPEMCSLGNIIFGVLGAFTATQIMLWVIQRTPLYDQGRFISFGLYCLAAAIFMLALWSWQY